MTPLALNLKNTIDGVLVFEAMEAKPNQRRGEQRASESLVPFHLMEKNEGRLLLIHQPGGLPPGRGEWPSGQKRQTVNLLKVFYVGSNPASPTFLRLPRRERTHSSA